MRQNVIETLPPMRVQPEPPEVVLWGVAGSPLGEVVVGVTEDGALARVSFLRGGDTEQVLRVWQNEWSFTHFEPRALPQDVLAGPLVVVGTELQKRIWLEIMRIPKGKLATYGDVADLIDLPGRARAVGRTCKMCCHAYVIPCHRVVAAHGLGGFGREGPDFKAELLALEGVTLPTLRR